VTHSHSQEEERRYILARLSTTGAAERQTTKGPAWSALEPEGAGTRVDFELTAERRGKRPADGLAPVDHLGRGD
jgi:hypothetical protein